MTMSSVTKGPDRMGNFGLESIQEMLRGGVAKLGECVDTEKDDGI